MNRSPFPDEVPQILTEGFESVLGEMPFGRLKIVITSQSITIPLTGRFFEQAMYSYHTEEKGGPRLFLSSTLCIKDTDDILWAAGLINGVRTGAAKLGFEIFELLDSFTAQDGGECHAYYSINKCVPISNLREQIQILLGTFWNEGETNAQTPTLGPASI